MSSTLRIIIRLKMWKRLPGSRLSNTIKPNRVRSAFFFFDTWLIITKVWFRWVYERVPEWLENEIKLCPVDLFLLCRPDLPWEADQVRENGGENRIRLYNEYLVQLRNYGFNFVEIGGSGEERLANAVSAIRNFSGQK